MEGEVLRVDEVVRGVGDKLDWGGNSAGQGEGDGPVHDENGDAVLEAPLTEPFKCRAVEESKWSWFWRDGDV